MRPNLPNPSLLSQSSQQVLSSPVPTSSDCPFPSISALLYSSDSGQTFWDWPGASEHLLEISYSRSEASL